MLKRILFSVFALAAVIALAAAPAAACGGSACMEIPAYATCAQSACSTKETCNNAAGPACTYACENEPNPSTCTAQCLTNAFEQCDASYQTDMGNCFDQHCYWH